MLYDDGESAIPDGDPYEPTQTQQTTQSQSQVQPEVWNTEIWGKLVPMLEKGTVVDFYKTTKKITVGRGQHNSLRLPGVKVSNDHCTIEWDEVHDEVKVKDKSRNGTYISGELVGKDKSRYLTNGAEIVFGQGGAKLSPDDYRFIFRYNAKVPPDGLYKEYDVGKELGRGSFATVLKGIRKCDGADVAIKSIHKSRLAASSEKSKLAFLREIEIMKNLNHPYICKLYQTFDDDLTVYLVLEFCTDGDLLDYIIKHGGLDEETAKNFTYQIVDAMSYVHQKNIAHRDLKPENVLLTGGNLLTGELPSVKIADFGLAKALDGVTKFKTMCGTPLYLAPEVVLKNQDDPYTLNVDSWSVGVIVFCMLANAVPFEDDDAADMNERFKNRRPDFQSLAGKGVSKTCMDFLLRMLDFNPKTRMTCTKALRHPWLGAMRKIEQRAGVRPLDVAERSGEPSSRIPLGDVSMLANAGSYIDAEEAANSLRLGADGLYDDDIARTARSMAQEYSVNEASMPPPAQGIKLERRTMEMFKEDVELGSYQYVTDDMLQEATPSPATDEGAGPSTDRGNLKRKERSEIADEDYDMGRASDNSSNNSMATTPVSGNNDAVTPTEERNLRPKGGNKRSKC